MFTTPAPKIINFYPDVPRGVILQNRINWHTYLQQPEARHWRNSLESIREGNARCCLGHACHVLGVPRRVVLNGDWKSVYYAEQHGYAPKVTQRLLGLCTEDARVFGNLPEFMVTECGYACTTFAHLNDVKRWTPQKIGELLETMVDGGPGTPYFPLTAYRA